MSYLPHSPKNSKIKARVAHLYYFPLSLSRGWFSSFPSLSVILDSRKSIPQDSEGKEGGKMAKKNAHQRFLSLYKDQIWAVNAKANMEVINSGVTEGHGLVTFSATLCILCPISSIISGRRGCTLRLWIPQNLQDLMGRASRPGKYLFFVTRETRARKSSRVPHVLSHCSADSGSVVVNSCQPAKGWRRMRCHAVILLGLFASYMHSMRISK